MNGNQDSRTLSGTDPEERLITLKEAARTLGISIRALYRLIATRELPPPLKVGRASRMELSEIGGYIDRLKAERR